MALVSSDFPPDFIETKYWHGLDGEESHRSKVIQCDVCPRACKLHPQQRGLCYVRGRQEEGVELYSYGRSSGFCIDPIEKKPLNHFLPGTPVLSFGTAGCNLACKFCQNWDMSKSREMDTLASVAMPEQVAQSAAKYNCRSIAFTYNDPVIFLEYAIDTAIACREKNIRSVAVTAGYICEEPREQFFTHMDATNIDLKSFDEKFYYKLCGAHLKNVLETLEYVYHKTNTWLEITTLLIPGKNDSDSEIHRLSEWVVEKLGPDVPLHFTAFHPDWKMRDVAPTPPSTLTRAREIACSKGLQFVYTGNVHDSIGSSTYCPECKHCLVERDWYELGRWELDAEGACVSCGTKIPGVFEASPGRWGARRQAIRIVE